MHIDLSRKFSRMLKKKKPGPEGLGLRFSLKKYRGEQRFYVSLSPCKRRDCCQQVLGGAEWLDTSRSRYFKAQSLTSDEGRRVFENCLFLDWDIDDFSLNKRAHCVRFSFIPSPAGADATGGAKSREGRAILQVPKG